MKLGRTIVYVASGAHALTYTSIVAREELSSQAG